MFQVIGLTILFSISTVISILLLGNRSIVGGDMGFMRIIQILFGWHFIVGAIFAFMARLFFMMINSALYKMPALADSSTTITTLITTVSLIFVIVANYFFLHERITPIQMVGAFVIFVGIFLVTR